MRVLALAETLKPLSGWGRYASAVIAEYERRGISYSVITSLTKDATGTEAGFLEKPSLVGFVKNIFLVRRLAKDVDVVHAYDFWPFGVYAYFAVLGTGKRLFLSAVGTYTIAPFDNPVKRFLLTLVCRRAQTIFSIGNYTKRRLLEKLSLSNVETVFWGTSVLKPIPPEERKKYYAEFNIPETHGPVLLTVGQIKNRKGQLDTLKAVAKLKDAYPQILYVVVGSDEDTVYVNEMRAFAEENRMAGNLRIISKVKSDTELSFFYSIADLFVMNSNNEGNHFEGFGLVFLEAEQFGIPVVGSQGCGIEEALEDGYNGYLTKQGDSIDIAEKIATILGGKAAEFGEHSREFFTRFSWEKTVSAYVAGYERKS
jgi:glycosyltransferase involved in cell wall biosynthesis